MAGANGPRRTALPSERFWRKVSKRGLDECWPWLGGIIKSSWGYGSFYSTRMTTAHRYSYELNRGDIPAGMFVCHTCDNPPCVNPAHLFLGTAKDNTQDMMRKGRRAPVVFHGSAHGMAKISEPDVVEMRRLRSLGMTYRSIASRYGLTASGAAKVCTGFLWKHVPMNTENNHGV